MNFNTVCVRIAFVLALLLSGGVTLVLYAGRIFTPLAVSLLPTNVVPARYAGDFIHVELELGAMQQIYRSPITYAGRETTLVTTSPATPLVTQPAGDGFGKTGEKKVPDDVEFNVRYVRLFPAMVVRDLPGGSLWSYYQDTWIVDDLVHVLVALFFTLIIGYFFFRHVRRCRRGY